MKNPIYRAGWLRRGAALLLSVAAATCLHGQSKPASTAAIDRVADAMFAITEFHQTALSPDGSRVAWVENLPGTNGESAIYVSQAAAAEGSRPVRIQAMPSRNAREGSVAWSPDSRRLAFLSDAELAGQRQLYVVDATGGERRALTHVKGFLADPQWSPRGKSLAILFTANAPRAAGPLEPMTPDSGVVEEHFYEQRIAIVDSVSGEIKEVSPADLYVYEYDWSPDGASFAATAARGSGDNNWWVAQLYTISAENGAAKSILKPELQIAEPRWSPDGARIAYIGGLMSDQGVTGGDVFVVGRDGRNLRNLTPGVKASATWLSWLSPSQIFAVENVAGVPAAVSLDLSPGQAGAAAQTLWRSDKVISAESHALGVSLSRDGRSWSAIRSSAQDPPEVWTGHGGNWTQITHANQNTTAPRTRSKNISWQNDGSAVQGWLNFPANFAPGKSWPLVVAVHGGPSSACMNDWPRSITALLPSQGYFVLCVNPRGSYGQGEAFTLGNVKDFGYGDLRDILTGVDAVKLKYPIDEARLGIAGWSYGGYMTMWAVTQTNRFHAAVAGAGVANWQSYYGENDIDQWMIPFFGSSVYDDPAIYARSSPMTFIKKVKTPTLILVGDRDGEVPAPQSYEFWHALKTLGTPTELVVYPNEGHNIAQPEHRRDRLVRIASWFDRYLR